MRHYLIVVNGDQAMTYGPAEVSTQDEMIDVLRDAAIERGVTAILDITIEGDKLLASVVPQQKLPPFDEFH